MPKSRLEERCARLVAKVRHQGAEITSLREAIKAAGLKIERSNLPKSKRANFDRMMGLVAK